MIYAVYSEADQESFSFTDGLLPALICILIVFSSLAILALILGLLNRMKALDVKEKKVESSPSVTKNTDIADEDMMVAVLAATIDYREIVKTDVELVSVKQIG